jgi:hypothetical protein
VPPEYVLKHKHGHLQSGKESKIQAVDMEFFKYIKQSQEGIEFEIVCRGDGTRNLSIESEVKAIRIVRPCKKNG